MMTRVDCEQSDEKNIRNLFGTFPSHLRASRLITHRRLRSRKKYEEGVCNHMRHASKAGTQLKSCQFRPAVAHVGWGVCPIVKIEFRYRQLLYEAPVVQTFASNGSSPPRTEKHVTDVMPLVSTVP